MAVQYQVSRTVSVHLLPASLLTASSSPGLTVCVCLPAACLPATCPFVSKYHSVCLSTCSLPSCYLPDKTKSHSRCPSTCSLTSCYLPVQNQVSKSVTVHLLTAFLLPTSSTPGLKYFAPPPAACLAATCQFNTRSHSLCLSTCCLHPCYLPVRIQDSQFVSVYLLPAFLLPACLIPGLTACVRLSAACLPPTCQFDSRSHSLFPYSCCLPSSYLPGGLQVSQSVPSTCSLPSCYLPVQLQVSHSVSVHQLPAFHLPASLTPGLTDFVRPSAACLPPTCQFDSRSHSRCPSS